MILMGLYFTYFDIYYIHFFKDDFSLSNSPKREFNFSEENNEKIKHYQSLRDNTRGLQDRIQMNNHLFKISYYPQLRKEKF